MSAGCSRSDNLRMPEFMGSPLPLPQPISRNHDDYASDLEAETPRVTHAAGYETIAHDIPIFSAPEEVAAWIDGKDIPVQELAIFCGNWLIAYRQNGYWVHIVEGRPEVYVAGIGSVDMVSVAEDLLRGNGRVFRYVASA